MFLLLLENHFEMIKVCVWHPNISPIEKNVKKFFWSKFFHKENKVNFIIASMISNNHYSIIITIDQFEVEKFNFSERKNTSSKVYLAWNKFSKYRLSTIDYFDWFWLRSSLSSVYFSHWYQLSFVAFDKFQIFIKTVVELSFGLKKRLLLFETNIQFWMFLSKTPITLLHQPNKQTNKKLKKNVIQINWSKPKLTMVDPTIR